MNRLRVTLLFLIGLTAAPSAFAAGGGGGTWLGLPTWVWAWANLIVFWGLLWRFAGPPLREFLEKRREAIAAGIDRAKNQEKEAEQMRAELGAQLEALRAELREQKERAAVEGERERERILAQAEAERAKLLAQADREIDNRVAQAEAELRRLTASLAADLAREHLQSRIGDEERERLVADGVRRLGEVAS